ncbi:MAG: histidine phosphatase family protein [Clostridia bacterium]|nr:histidine phosphatase family protein [Clostridia bacterium]
MKLYMVRHGESQTNLERRFTGQAQAPLTEKGIADAKAAGERLKGLHFDRIYSSDLIRAADTARYAIPGCEPVQLPLIRELDVGAKLEWRTVAECEAEYGEELMKHRNAYDYTPYGGENEAQLAARADAFLHMLEEDPCNQVVAFSHAGFISCTLCQVLGHSFNRKHIRCLNASIAVFSYENGRWILEKWGV